MVEILNFIEKTNSAQNEAEIFDLFQDQLMLMGFDRVVYTLATDHPSIGKEAGHGIMRNYPNDWMEHYGEQQYQAIDPVIHHAAVSSRPFVWDEMNAIMPFTNEQKKLINESKEAKLYCGVGLGIHCGNSELVAFGFASPEKDAELNKNTVSIIRLLANQFHFAYSEMQRKNIGNRISDININLTRKELEVLHWSAQGKSYGVIASVMSISENTVDFHMRSIFRKLQTNDRITAIVKSIKFGLIHP